MDLCSEGGFLAASASAGLGLGLGLEPQTSRAWHLSLRADARPQPCPHLSYGLQGGGSQASPSPPALRQPEQGQKAEVVTAAPFSLGLLPSQARGTGERETLPTSPLHCRELHFPGSLAFRVSSTNGRHWQRLAGAGGQVSLSLPASCGISRSGLLTLTSILTKCSLSICAPCCAWLRTWALIALYSPLATPVLL